MIVSEMVRSMSVELWTLLGAMFLGLLHLSAASFAFKAQVGLSLIHI